MPAWGPPENLSELIRDKLGIRLICEACGHTAERDPLELRTALTMLGGRREDLKELHLWLRCTHCRKKKARYEIVSAIES